MMNLRLQSFYPSCQHQPKHTDRLWCWENRWMDMVNKSWCPLCCLPTAADRTSLSMSKSFSQFAFDSNGCCCRKLHFLIAHDRTSFLFNNLNLNEWKTLIRVIIFLLSTRCTHKFTHSHTHMCMHHKMIFRVAWKNGLDFDTFRQEIICFFAIILFYILLYTRFKNIAKSILFYR